LATNDRFIQPQGQLGYKCLVLVLLCTRHQATIKTMILCPPFLRSWLVLLAAASNSAVVHGQAIFDDMAANRAVTVVVGEDRDTVPSFVGWTEGVCYLPILEGVRPGDTLEFRFEPHNVYQMASKQHFLDCNFSDATLLAEVGESPFRFTIDAEYGNQVGQEDVFYFACKVGDHCAAGTQKIQVAVQADLGDIVGQGERQPPISKYVLGTTTQECDDIQLSNAAVSELGQAQANALRSTCEDPVPVEGQPGTYMRTCLSGPATLTPGGVVNRLFVLNYPFPMDHRVALGQRVFDMVMDNPENPKEHWPVDHSQLYIHHMAGRVVFSQGAESMGQMGPDAPFPPPFARLTGNDGPATIFHLIDLRNVTDWLSCVECRCPDNSGKTYLDDLTQTGNVTGGVSCCSNCTDLEGLTVDYRMRYNVTYRELAEEEMALEATPEVVDVDLLVADIAPAVDMMLEYNVPSYQWLPEDQQVDGNPYIQHLERVGPFSEIFQRSFFAGPYDAEEISILRCVSHLHIASITQYLEDAETGERYCEGTPIYGTTPDVDKGFVTTITVNNHDPPITIPASRVVRLVTEYNATHVHSGVMGYLFVFVSGGNLLTSQEMNLTVPICNEQVCDTSILPSIDMGPFQGGLRMLKGGCVDTIANSPSCRFAGICDCKTFVEAPESTGCGGVYKSTFGDTEINSLCPAYCDACVDVSMEEVFEEAYTSVMTEHYRSLCQYDTAECRAALSNLHSCGEARSGMEAADPLLQFAVTRQGQRIAQETAKLGEPSLHGSQGDQLVGDCVRAASTEGNSTAEMKDVANDNATSTANTTITEENAGKASTSDGSLKTSLAATALALVMCLALQVMNVRDSYYVIYSCGSSR